MRVKKVTLGLVLALTAVILGTLIYNFSVGEGVLEGRVTIGPWTPVEPIGGSHPPPEVYTSRRIVLEGALFQKVGIPMDGTGFFSARVKAGAYSLTMTNCTFLGCSRVLPTTVTVKTGETTTVDIDIDTGIR